MTNEPTRSLNTSFTSENADLDSEGFSTFLDNYDYHFSPGDIVAGTVFSIEPRGALIDIGARTAAYIPIQEMSINRIDSPEEVLQPNETREFFILTDENEDGQLTLSIRRIEYMCAWERVRQLQAENVTIRSTVFATNRGGALVRVEGLRGFIPGSHISTRKPKEELIGEDLPLKFLEVDEEKNRLVLSHRRALVEREMNRLEVGEIVSGTVRGIKSYGAFIDIGGVSALLPVSEISHSSIENPGSVFQVNDEIKVIILDLDTEKGRISVSTKLLEPEPGDMLRNPQLVYAHAEEMASRYRDSTQTKNSANRVETLDFHEEEIISYEQNLQETSPELFPEEWAANQVKLANTYLNRTQGDRSDNLERAIAACESALQVYTHETFPESWAQTQFLLAKIYSERIRGDRAENIERALAAYRLALQVYTHEDFPVQWAATQNNLANAYYSRIRGSKAQNIEDAIAAYEQSLTVRTQVNLPVEWVQTTNNLANAYYSRIQGDRAENLEYAISAYQQALTVVTQSAMPLQWANTMMNLATAYASRVQGDRSENLERAIAACESALQIYTREGFPQQWAKTQSFLAEIFFARIRGDRSDNLEQAIAAYESALQIYTREDFPEQWANAQSFLAQAYSNRIRGDHAENIERAIAVCQLALQVYTREAFPEDWAKTQTNLAIAYSKRFQGDRADNIEQSISAYESALQVYTHEAFPKDWVRTQMGLAEVYFDRIQGDRVGNTGQAIVAYTEAAQVFRQLGLAQELSRTLHNLGLACNSQARNKIEPDQNRERAIEAYIESSQIRRQLSLHRDLSITLNNLGAVYYDSQRFEEAIRSWNESLAICQEQSDSLNSFDAISYLGNVYRDLSEYQQSFDCLQQALNIARDVGGYYHQLKALNNLGSTYYCLNEYQQALNCYQEALPIAQEWGDHRSKSLTLIGLADAYQALGNYQQSVDLYEQALATSQQITDEELGISIQSKLAQALLQSESFERAIAVAQSIPDQERRLEVLTTVVEEVQRLGGDQVKELLAPLRDDSDERINQVMSRILEPIPRTSGLTEYKNLTELLQACIVKISVPGQAGWGTGSFISPGLILTCAFVVNRANSGSIDVVWQGQSYTAEISVMEARGIAVLRFWPQLSLKHPCIYLGEIDEAIQPGDRLYSFGYTDDFPNGSSVTFECEGLTGDAPPLLKFKSGQVRPGLGGAPLLNLRTGKICGIVNSTRDRSSNLGGDAIPAKVILSRSPDLEEPYRLFHERDKTWTSLLPHPLSQNELSRLQVQKALSERLRSCTLKLRKPNQTSWGTGYLVKSNLILTCDFVVNRDGSNPIEVDWVEQGLLETATVEAIIPNAGLALLRISDPLFEEIDPVELDTDNAQLEDSFYSYGYPDQDYQNGCSVTFKCAGIARGDNDLPILNLVEGQIRPGMGGSPVLNLRTGKVAGIVKYTNDRSWAAGGGAILSTYILSQFPQLAQSGHQSPQPSSRIPQHLTYCVFFRSLQETISLGSEFEISVSLSPFVESQSDTYLLEISRDELLGNELNILVTAAGFQVEGDSAVSLPLDLDTNIQQISQTASFRLIALRPGTSTITVELYRGDTFETTLEKTIQVVGLEESDFLDSTIKTEPRPVSQPDLVLQVQTLWNETTSTCTFRYHLRSFRASSLLAPGITYQSSPLSGSWLEQLHELLKNTLETISDALPADGRSHLTSLGQYLFQHLFPTELQTDLRNLNRYQALTLLILADQDAQFPWILLHTGQEFLGERFIIGHWLWDLNNAHPYEFPVGAINVAHYANVEQSEVWATLLEPPGAPPPFILTGGVLDDLTTTEAMRGLHLLRVGQSATDAERRDAPVPLEATTAEQDIDQKVRPIKLNLRRNRPLVTLGYLRDNQPELTHLQQTWAATFIRAGCSAFVGSLWAVNPATEAAFISSFYHALWTGDSLGGAFQTARRLARATVPDSLDWLAYLLFGDPMARPYRPVQGQGYAVVEPIGQEIDDPVPPGSTIRFRVSLRRTPPVWHEERVIEVAETLTFNDLQAHIVTFGLQVTPATSIPLRPAPSGNYLGWFNLIVPPDITGDSALVQVYFADGMQTVHTLTFPLSFRQEGGQQA